MLGRLGGIFGDGWFTGKSESYFHLWLIRRIEETFKKGRVVFVGRVVEGVFADIYTKEIDSIGKIDEVPKLSFGFLGTVRTGHG